MSASDLKTQVIIAKKINIDREMKNVVDYTATEMITLLTDSTHFVASSNNCSFIRNTGVFQTDFDYGTILESNYMAFQNLDYSSKWFFAWIDDVIYKGDKNTEIRFTVDSFTTFNKDLTYENCNVIREHVNDDTIGLHTIPENIDVGDVVQEGSTGAITELTGSSYYVALDVTAIPQDNTGDNGGHLDFAGATMINGLFRGTSTVIIKTGQYLQDFLHRMNKDNILESVKNMYITPSWIFTETGLVNDLTQHSAKTTFSGSSETTFYFFTVNSSAEHKTLNLNVNKTTAFTGFTPKNNKCFVYPYNYLLVSNNVGQTTIYKYEDFSTTNCTFDLVGLLSIGGSYKLIPKDYKGIAKNYDESMPLAKYPTCSFVSDAYTSWITQNAANQYANIATEGIMGALHGGISGGFGGAIAGALLPAAGEILGTMNDFKKADLLPNSVVGQSTGDINWKIGGNNFFFRHMHPKIEYLRVIDDFFTRFGYKVNRLKTPNITGRTYFNYVEIASSDDVATGSIPHKYMDEINKAFRKGITIWHDHSKIGDYTVNNTIVT